MRWGETIGPVLWDEGLPEKTKGGKPAPYICSEVPRFHFKSRPLVKGPFLNVSNLAEVCGSGLMCKNGAVCEVPFGVFLWWPERVARVLGTCEWLELWWGLSCAGGGSWSRGACWQGLWLWQAGRIVPCGLRCCGLFLGNSTALLCLFVSQNPKSKIPIDKPRRIFRRGTNNNTISKT